MSEIRKLTEAELLQDRKQNPVAIYRAVELFHFFLLQGLETDEAWNTVQLKYGRLFTQLAKELYGETHSGRS